GEPDCKPPDKPPWSDDEPHDDVRDVKPICKPPDKPPWSDNESPDPNLQSGSIIQVENQTLGEAVDVVGTPFRLNYSSERVPGRAGAYTLRIPIEAESAFSFLGTEIEIEVAGRKFEEKIDKSAEDQEFKFTWDGKDAFGRILQGPQPVTVFVKRR